MNPFDPTKLPSPPSPGGEDDLIELTEVMEEGPVELTDDASAEVVLDFRAEYDLSSLKSPVEPPEEKPPALPKRPPEESLDDFLASLPELPEDLDVPPEDRLVEIPAALEAPLDLAGRLSDDELRELVRQAVQETVERLARELFPRMASEAIERELTLWKKRLTEPS